LISRNDAPKYGFGTSTRQDIAGGQTLNTKRTISESGRESSPSSVVNLKPLVPGPGTYELNSFVGNEGPKRSLAGRFKIDLVAKELNSKPGPGAYTPSANFSIKQSPNYKIGTSTREKYYLKDKFKEELPSPNLYNPDFQKLKQKAPATGLGYGERSQMSKTFNIPGPGAYKSPTAIGEGPRYGLGARIADTFEHKKAKELPSPFHYNPKFEALAKTQSVFSIGKSKRVEISGNRRLNVPGPGTYIGPKGELPTLRDAPKWGFGSSERPQIGKTAKQYVPGPGSYQLKSTFADVPNYLIPNQKPNYV
jgi:hypothetical protein